MPYATFRPCVLCGPVLQQTLFLLQLHLQRGIAVRTAVTDLAVQRYIQLASRNALVVGAADAGICTDFMMTGTLERQLGQRQQQCHTAEHAEPRLAEVDRTRIIITSCAISSTRGSG